VRLPGVRKVAEVGELLDLAFDADTAAWQLDSHGEWTVNGGSVHLQEELIRRQRRHR
jgi:polyphosphate kinase